MSNTRSKMTYTAKMFINLVIMVTLFMHITMDSVNALAIHTRHSAFRPDATAARATILKHFPSDTMDFDRTQYCISHPGECSIAEMESLKNGNEKHAVYLFV
jgi:hypothetical protein